MSALLPGDPLSTTAPEALDDLIEKWRDPAAPPLSRHLLLEIACVVHRGWKPGSPPVLRPGEPVPGCTCPACTGIPLDHPARASLGPARPARRQRAAGTEEQLDVEAARRVPILDVARRLGLGEPRRVGREYVVRCPLHDDRRPSLRLDPRRNLWYCDPCATGGDGLRLYMAARRCTFREAIEELAP